MRSFGIVEGEICTQSLGSLGHGLVVLEIDFFILDASPESLHEDVIPAPPSSIPTDTDAFLFESVCKIFTCELRALIAVEDAGVGVPDRSFPGLRCRRKGWPLGASPGRLNLGLG